MRKLKLTQARQKLFLEALADTGSVTKAVAVAGTSRTRVYELQKVDPAFAAAWAEAEDIAVDRLEDEARRRAVEGVPELGTLPGPRGEWTTRNWLWSVSAREPAVLT